MAAYNRIPEYDFSLFEGSAVRQPVQLPVEAPEQEKKQPVRKQQTKKNPQPKNKQQLRAESRTSAWRAVRIIGIACVLVGLFTSVLWSRVSLTMLEREETKLAVQLQEAQSENVRLRMLMSTATSREKIEEYAENVLGMQKCERYQIHYFRSEDADRIIQYGSDNA